jgi:hypothetical protein
MAEQIANSKKKRTGMGIFWYWIQCLAKIAVAIVVLFVLVGVLYQAIASVCDMRRYPPSGKLVDIGVIFTQPVKERRP